MKKIAYAPVFLLSVYCSFASTDKYRLVLTDDPATTITVAWNQISGTDPVLYYDDTDYGTDYTKYDQSRTVDRVVAYRGMNNHFVRLKGLQPNTSYYFVIRDSEGISTRYWFKTAPGDKSRLSFIAGGDSRNNSNVRKLSNELVSKLKPHAVFFGGDMTDDDTDIQWKRWMDDWQLTIASDGRMFPIVPARGNHEGTMSIFNLFDTPDENSYYALTFGDELIRFYTLNTNISVSGNQRTWLQQDLDSHSDMRWRIAQYHKPMRPHTSGKSEGQTQYSAWARLFFDFRVKLVIECDSHVGKLTWPVEPSVDAGSDEGFKLNQNDGTVYVGEGGWGAPLRANNDDKLWTRNSGSFNQFKLIFVDDQEIEVRTIKINDVANVSEVTNDDPFTLPTNLDVWTPSNGAVVTITPSEVISQNPPDIEFTDATPTVYDDGANIVLDIKVNHPGNGIDSVAFYVNDTYTQLDNSPPYQLSYAYSSGQYTIKAVATASDDLMDSARIVLNVGAFNKEGNVPILDGMDDVEETEAGTMYFTSSDLELVYDDYTFEGDTANGFQTIGLRFQDVTIPHGAHIDSAFIQFRSDETDNPLAEYLIQVEDIGDAPTFESNKFNVSSRKVMPTFVEWRPLAWLETEQYQSTPDLTDIVQSVIDRDDWRSGNSMAFVIEGLGQSLSDPNAKRVADSYEGSAPPVLVFSYSFDAKSVLMPEYPNIRFASGTPTTYLSGTDVSLDISVLNPGNGIDSVTFFVNGIRAAVDISADYQHSNTFTDGQYEITAVATAHDGLTDTARIVLNVGAFSIVRDVSIRNGRDDVEETQFGAMYSTSSDLELVYDNFTFEGDTANGFQTIGLRFQDIYIPVGASIDSAFIQFRSDETDDLSAEFSIQVMYVGDARPFGDVRFDVSSRPALSKAIEWRPPAWTETDQSTLDQRTPDIARLVQSIIRRDDWIQGNNIVFIIKGIGESLNNPEAKRVVDSYEGNAPARLVFAYSFDAQNLAVDRPDIEFAHGTPTVYKDGMDVLLDIDVVEEGSGIESVTFYVDNVQAAIDYDFPYQFNYTYLDGQYKITAVATATDNLIDTTQIILNIGVFTGKWYGDYTQRSR